MEEEERQDIGQMVKLAENRSAPSRSLAFFDRRHFLRNISSKCVPGVTFNIKGGRWVCGPWPVGGGRWACRQRVLIN